MRFQRLRAKRARRKKKKEGRNLEVGGGVWCMSEGGQGEINICVASVHLPGVPRWFPGCKMVRIPNGKKSERREDKKRGGTLLWLSDSWWPMGAEVWGDGIKGWRKRREKQYVNKYREKKDSQRFLSVSFDLCLLFSPPLSLCSAFQLSWTVTCCPHQSQ